MEGIVGDTGESKSNQLFAQYRLYIDFMIDL